MQHPSLTVFTTMRSFQFMHPLWDATYVRKSGHKVFGFQFMHPLWDATGRLTRCGRATKFQFMHPLWDATFSPDNRKHSLEHFNSCIPYGMQPQNIVFIFPFILYFVYIVLYYLPLYPLHNHIYQFTFLYWCESPSAFMCA